MARTPTGWPAELPPPGSPEFRERVVGWLLDQGPAPLRASSLRAHPRALAAALDHIVEGQIDGLRRAYATTRSDVRGTQDEPATAEILAGIEAAGAGLLQLRREIQAVRAALGEVDAQPGGAADE